MNIPAKIKIFYWQAYRHCLPLKMSLIAQKVPREIACPVYHKKLKTVLHGLWGCKWLKEVRADCSFMSRINWVDGMHFLDFILSCYRCLDKDDMLLLLIVVFLEGLVFTQQMVHSQGNQGFELVVPWAMGFLKEFKKANKVRDGVAFTNDYEVVK
ncbi:hypothetical protein LWI28_011843 [Acer negundo]|uniref:Reverse transcriptase zinc-binding domain-containing protein n=1 Tax=Acer negundo TaxID=4023 RepID=A0AAD5IZR4_ACENE|nr:hypothetical protein LWI28_011843 [Acer negundo]